MVIQSSLSFMYKKTPFKHAPSTSWQPVSDWYNSAVGESGHYYHKQVVLPNTLRLLQLSSTDSLLDLGCGQGVLARAIPKDVYYLGLDISADLIEQGKKYAAQNPHHFAVANVARPTLPVKKTDFSHAAFILSLQNMADSAAAIKNAAHHLRDKGKLVLVLNHPCFRIPRQSSWGIDETKKLQYRRIDRYLSPIKIPITAHPGKKDTSATWSFHQSLSSYFTELAAAGFVVTHLEEWTSDKTSEGRAAKMENRGRSEFPLFLTLVARKIVL
jgi:SAM-dependent methyltransferase